MGGLIGTATIDKDGLQSKNSYMNRGIINDANLATKEGVYIMPTNTINSPSEDYSLLFVRNCLPYIIQESWELNTTGIFYRVSIDGGVRFRKWTKY